MALRAVIYARYSLDSQRDASIEDQIRVCQDMIDREGWTLVQIYKDAARSGSSSLRPGYQALLRDARAAEFDVIVAEALDRLSRDQEDVAALFKRAKYAGIHLQTLAEGEISELHVGLKGTMNALFLKDLADKTRRGLRGRVENGRSGGGITYGYDMILRLDGNGELVRGERAINPGEAETVRSIFRDYAAGLSPKRIAFALNERKTAGPRGGLWAPSTINGNRDRGTGILNNELYVGRLVWNKLTYFKDPDTGRRQSRLNALSKVVSVGVPSLQIVDATLWEAVRSRQSLLDSEATKTDVGCSPHGVLAKRRPQTLFSGLMHCGCCGGGYSKTGARHFGCSTARNKGPSACTNMLTVRQDRLEDEVLTGLRERLMDPALFQVFAREFAAEWNRLQAGAVGDRDRWAADRVLLTTQIDRLVDAVAAGKAPKAVVNRIAALEAERDDLDAKVATAPAPAPHLHPALPTVYRRKVAGLTQALAADDGGYARDAVRQLVEDVRLVPEDGRLRIEVRGELSTILALGGGAGGANRHLDLHTLRGGGRRGTREVHPSEAFALAQQVKRVAGTGFEPVTFRL